MADLSRCLPPAEAGIHRDQSEVRTVELHAGENVCSCTVGEEVPRRSANCPGRGHHLVRGDDVPDRTCSIEGCDNAHYSRGWCQRHYGRWYRNGDPLGGVVRSDNSGPCEIDGCDSNAAIRQMCTKHYRRWRLYGDPFKLRRRPILDTPQERFWQKVQVDPVSGCWLWDGARDPAGYGCVTIDGQGDKAHRVAYRWMRGQIPEGFHVDHLCRTPACVNPAHLDAVEAALNTHRGDRVREETCNAGHPLSGDNIYLWTNPKNGYTKRFCRACQRERKRERRREGRG